MSQCTLWTYKQTDRGRVTFLSEDQETAILTGTERGRHYEDRKQERTGDLSSEYLRGWFVVDQTHGVLVLCHALDELSFRQSIWKTDKIGVVMVTCCLGDIRIRIKFESLSSLHNKEFTVVGRTLKYCVVCVVCVWPSLCLLILFSASPSHTVRLWHLWHFLVYKTNFCVAYVWPVYIS